MKNKLFFLSICFISFNVFSQTNYKGKPWDGTFQTIPGKLECEKYDFGGEGIAYHDKDSINTGAHALDK